MQLLNLVLKFLCAPLGVAVSGHQTELILHLMKGVLRSLDAVAHTLTGDAGVLGDLGKRKIFIVIQIKQLALLLGEGFAVEVKQQAHFKRCCLHGDPPSEV